MSKPQHILHILPYLETGGTEKHVLTLITTLRDLGLCTGEVLAPAGPFAQQLAAANIPHTEFVYASAGLRASWRSFNSTYGHLAEKADIIHVHGAPDLILFAAKARAAKRPRLLTIHGFHGKGAGFSYRFASFIGNRYADAMICVVGSEEKLLLAAGSKPNKLHRIYNGVADPTLGAAPPQTTTSEANAPVRIGFIGRLSPVKGIDVLLAALASLKAQGSVPIHLDIMGEGPQASTLAEQAHNLCLTEQVTFHGYCPDAVARLAHCDIFCLPSREDMGPLVIAEAMAQGKPIVSTWVGGIPEMVEHAVTGLLVPADNPSALAAALGKLVNNATLRQQMGAAGRQRYETLFAQESMARKTHAVYCSICQ